MSEDEERLRPGEAGPGEGERSEAEIDFNVMGSFHASDPPSWTLEH
ncbi:MAG TPA: hypothetical protein VF553_04810 [Pyrinomonadaceae bacterium]|jgi:hypothetical protein